jgi:hypothetical protein
MNGKVCGKKKFWADLEYCSTVFPEELKRATETLD